MTLHRKSELNYLTTNLKNENITWDVSSFLIFGDCVKTIILRNKDVHTHKTEFMRILMKKIMHLRRRTDKEHFYYDIFEVKKMNHENNYCTNHSWCERELEVKSIRSYLHLCHQFNVKEVVNQVSEKKWFFWASAAIQWWWSVSFFTYKCVYVHSIHVKNTLRNLRHSSIVKLEDCDTKSIWAHQVFSKEDFIEWFARWKVNILFSFFISFRCSIRAINIQQDTIK